MTSIIPAWMGKTARIPQVGKKIQKQTWGERAYKLPQNPSYRFQMLLRNVCLLYVMKAISDDIGRGFGTPGTVFHLARRLWL